jgi:para-aminobenzoate synthetase/4-amino-4-deoxychorismate lyase
MEGGTVKWIDGRFVGGDAAVPALGPAPFETMAAVGTALPLWQLHLARLLAAAARLHVAAPPPPGLRAAASELLSRSGDDVLRLQVAATATGTSWSLASRSLGHALTAVRLLPCVVRRAADLPPADVKATPRRFYDDLLAEAQLAGADDGIAIGDDGAVLETAIANLWLRLDDVWVTPPLDGRVLPGIARALLLARAGAAGIAVAERRVDLADLHRADALMVSNAVHGPRPAGLLGSPGLTVGNPDTRWPPLWRLCMSG